MNTAGLSHTYADTQFIRDCREFALNLAGLAGTHSLAPYEKHKQKPSMYLERKQDNSIVTQTDRDIELLLRAEIQRVYPHHGIIGEEGGSKNESNENPAKDYNSRSANNVSNNYNSTLAYQWILDPIDGTKSFVTGVPLYTTLIALYSLQTRRVQLGVIYAPQTQELCSAITGEPMRYYWQFDKNKPNTGFVEKTVSKTTQLEKATIVSYDWGACVRHNSNAVSLLEKAACTRTWGDGFGYILLTTGRIDAVVDPTMHVWDIAALIPIIESAGGFLSDWKGNAISITDVSEDASMDVIAACTPELGKAILTQLASS